MEKIETLEEGLGIFDSMFVKTLSMLHGALPGELFTEDDYAKFYQCVRDLCHPDSPPDWQVQLYSRCVLALEKSIKTVVLPSIENQKDDCLLVVLYMWAKWRAIAKFYSRFLVHLPDHIHGENNRVPLAEARLMFHGLVCHQFFDKCCDAIISLINDERNGTLIVSPTVLKIFVAFSVEMGGEDTTAYYDLFEQVLFDDAAKYYSQIALDLLQSDSAAYIGKVLKLLSTEKRRGTEFLNKASLEKFIKVVTKHLVDETARKIIEKEKSKGLDTTYLKDVLSRISNTNFSDEDDAPKKQD